MICTEQEAKETACCKERAYLENGKLVTPACLASGCMAWRWFLSPGYGPLRQLNDGDCLMGNGEIVDAKDIPALHGHCGLAGRPGL